MNGKFAERPRRREPDLFDDGPRRERTARRAAVPGDYWNYCPNCGHRLQNERCKYRCPRCHYFMSCSDFD